MLVPHIADYRRGAGRLPLNGSGLDLPLIGAGLSALQLPQLEFQGLRCNVQTQAQENAGNNWNSQCDGAGEVRVHGNACAIDSVYVSSLSTLRTPNNQTNNRTNRRCF